MGALRIYLALCVIAAHAGPKEPVLPWAMHTGEEAVQMFYIISGFYMAMILTSGKYSKVQDFYLSRFLRVFPTYWVVLAGVLLVSASCGTFGHQWLALQAYARDPLRHNGMTGIVLAALSNFSIFGQDWIVFLSQPRGHPLSFTGHFRDDPSALWVYLAIPQCWSVAIELTFYLIVPYLNRLRTFWLVSIAGVATLARFILYFNLHRAPDPWTYRFFPFEIALFILGMLSYRAFVCLKPRLSPSLKLISWKSYALGAGLLLLSLYLHCLASAQLIRFAGRGFGLLASDSLCAIALPFLFFTFGNLKVDRLIGELSYPVYLVHWIVLEFIVGLLGKLKLVQFPVFGILTALISICLAFVLYMYLIGPLDRKRHNLTVSHPQKSDKDLLAAPFTGLT